MDDAVGRPSRRDAMRTVRNLLSEAGSAECVSRTELDRCRADLMVVWETAEQNRRGALAHLYELSIDVDRLIRRLLDDPELRPALARHGDDRHEPSSRASWMPA